MDLAAWRRRCIRCLPFLVVPALLVSSIVHAEDEPSSVQDRAAYMEDIARMRKEQLDGLRKVVGIRDDQAGLWRQVEQRLAGLHIRGAQIYLDAKAHEPTRELDQLELLNTSSAAEASDQRLWVDTLRWLYTQVDASQRERIDRMFVGDAR
ncbi:hypothetical protein [Stenotrophomonas sp. MMGLT7]|uniref:hypothetical protein n=1 Tax=Stenotrophomonas sp. MMGLT7 TaxID=2901227 RepID=UPI001E542A32|nr:hypothetical protein [Stenotrophomonas sp. MMGLT7]MCD7097838.1 hypothetical protein [Stenotrophomonas sp. MMGLT7]